MQKRLAKRLERYLIEKLILKSGCQTFLSKGATLAIIFPVTSSSRQDLREAKAPKSESVGSKNPRTSNEHIVVSII